MSSVDLIKRSGVNETTVPHLIHSLHSLQIAFTLRPILDRDDSPSSHTVLVVICKSCDLVAKELICPTAFAAEIACSDLNSALRQYITYW